MPLISVIILNWNTRDLLAECLQSIQDTTGSLDVETIVVDNASTDESCAMVREIFPGVRLIENHENVGFARGNNQGVEACRGKYALLLNSDAMLLPGAVQTMLEILENEPRAGMVGARLLNTDGSFQASYTPFPTLWREFMILSGLGRTFFGPAYPSCGPEIEKGPRVVDYIEGACLLARRDIYTAVGGLDEGYFMYAEEVDLCFAFRRSGWQVWYHPQAEVIHYGGASSLNRKPQREVDLYTSRVRFFRKNYGPLKGFLLKAMILTITAFKGTVHGLIRFISGGRMGRKVPSVFKLARKL